MYNICMFFFWKPTSIAASARFINNFHQISNTIIIYTSIDWSFVHCGDCHVHVISKGRPRLCILPIVPAWLHLWPRIEFDPPLSILPWPLYFSLRRIRLTIKPNSRSPLLRYWLRFMEIHINFCFTRYRGWIACANATSGFFVQNF